MNPIHDIMFAAYPNPYSWHSLLFSFSFSSWTWHILWLATLSILCLCHKHLGHEHETSRKAFTLF